MKRSKYGSVVLLVFALVAGANQMLWINFAPILAVIQEKYHVSEIMASSLLLVFPVAYVVFGIPAGNVPLARATGPAHRQFPATVH